MIGVVRKLIINPIENKQREEEGCNLMKLPKLVIWKNIWSKLESIDVNSYDYKHCTAKKEDGIIGLFGLLIYKYWARLFVPCFFIWWFLLFVLPPIIGYLQFPVQSLLVLYIPTIIFAILFTKAYIEYKPPRSVADILKEQYKDYPDHPVNTVPGYAEKLAASAEW